MEKNMNKKRDSWVQVFSGGKFYPFNPKSEDVFIEDIARSLSLQCRFNGHSNSFYSVGQHSLICAETLKENGYSSRIALLGLLHDASEAYFGDIPTPIKKFIPELKEIEAGIEKAIYEAFNLSEPTEEEIAIIKEMDVTLLVNEGRYLTSNEDQWVDRYYVEGQQILSSEIFNEAPKTSVEERFLMLFAALVEEALEEK